MVQCLKVQMFRSGVSDDHFAPLSLWARKVNLMTACWTCDQCEGISSASAWNVAQCITRWSQEEQ